MTTRPVRLDRLQAGIVAWLRQVLPAATVVWGPSELPRGAASDLLVAARFLTGPTESPIGGAATPTTTLPTVARLTVDPAAVPGDSVRVEASGWAWEYTLVGGDTPALARDALLARMTVAPVLVSATFAAQGTASIDVAALELGDLYQLRAGGPATWTVLDSEVAIVQASEVSALIELDFRATNRYPLGGAAAACSRVQSTLALPSVAELLDAYGLGVSPLGAPAQIDALSGPVWESRSVLSIRVSQLTLAAEAPGLIESVSATLVARSVTRDIEVTAAITVES